MHVFMASYAEEMRALPNNVPPRHNSTWIARRDYQRKLVIVAREMLQFVRTEYADIEWNVYRAARMYLNERAHIHGHGWTPLFVALDNVLREAIYIEQGV
jgi:hypothetical protein